MLFILLSLGVASTAAGSGQASGATSAAASHAEASAGATAKSSREAGAARKGLPSIISEDEIPAFLLTDPCDTEDS
jgi:hypothetical protein